MDVFNAFPKAIVAGVWELGQIVHDTDVGDRFVLAIAGKTEVIVDEVADTNLNASPSAETIREDTLLYARPYQLPTLNAAKLATGYLWWNTKTDQFYEITEVGIGKNQETGAVEHVEFKLQPTGAPDVQYV